MNHRHNIWKNALLTLVLSAALTSISCQPPVQQPPPPPQIQQTDTGRFQIVVSSEGDRGAVLFLLDTRDGGTWIYRPPTPPAFNGFWSDIPRLTYPPETWQQVFQTMIQQAQQAQQQPPPAGTATRSPIVPTPR